MMNSNETGKGKKHENHDDIRYNAIKTLCSGLPSANTAKLRINTTFTIVIEVIIIVMTTNLQSPAKLNFMYHKSKEEEYKISKINP